MLDYLTMKTSLLSSLFFGLLFSACQSNDTSFEDNSVKVVGAMKNVMWKGELGGVITLDTIANRKGLFGIGPLAYLKGEILLLNGRPYVSRVDAEGMPSVKIEENVTAPFFVYANQNDWKEITLPENVVGIPAIEDFVAQQTKDVTEPFVFKIHGTALKATYHIQNLADGSVVTNPDEAHAGQQSFKIFNKKVVIIGFYSKNHQGIFTHHDSNMHLHVITSDWKHMGHLDELTLDVQSGKLLLPKSMPK
jgi:acetolactate decarboxylase